MKNKLGTFLLLLILNALCIFAVEITTFKYKNGGSISGNGNPGIIALFIGLIFLVIFSIYMGSLFIKYFKKPTKKTVLVLLPTSLVLIFVSMIFAEINKVKLLHQHLNGFTNEENSIVYRFGWINQYTNSLFFNWYILIAAVSLTLLVAWIVISFQIREKS